MNREDIILTIREKIGPRGEDSVREVLEIVREMRNRNSLSLFSPSDISESCVVLSAHNVFIAGMCAVLSGIVSMLDEEIAEKKSELYAKAKKDKLSGKSRVSEEDIKTSIRGQLADLYKDKARTKAAEDFLKMLYYGTLELVRSVENKVRMESRADGLSARLS